MLCRVRTVRNQREREREERERVPNLSPLTPQGTRQCEAPLLRSGRARAERRPRRTNHLARGKCIQKVSVYQLRYNRNGEGECFWCVSYPIPLPRATPDSANHTSPLPPIIQEEVSEPKFLNAMESACSSGECCWRGELLRVDESFWASDALERAGGGALPPLGSPDA